MITEIKGNIFDTDCNVIGHGCNCKGGFGSGIAGQIKEQFPKVREEYIKYHNNIGWALGDVQLVSVDSFIIANCATQKEYLPRGICHADYHAIERICAKLRHFCKEDDLTLALPRIGCGLAGGDWEKVKTIYNRVFHDMDIKVYYL